MTLTQALAFHGTLSELADDAQALLASRYGTCATPHDGYSYHNFDHGMQVADAAYRLAHALHDIGRVSYDTVPLACVAGWWHDVEQGPGHEARSAIAADAEMRRRGLDPQHIATVQEMIHATRVVRVDGHRLVQAADPDDLNQAILADADLSSLGSQDGVWRALMLGIEQQHHAGQLQRCGELVPDRDAMLSFLTFQGGLFRDHQYLLPYTPRWYPHQFRNADLLDDLLARYTADRVSFEEILRVARQHAD